MPAWDGEALFLENPAHVDEVIADNSEPHPSFHSRGSFVAAAVQTVPPLEYADSPFTTSPPLLSLAEPASLLVSSALGALGGVIGNGDPLHAHVLDLGFPLRGVEASIAGDQFRCAVQPLFVNLHSRDRPNSRIVCARHPIGVVCYSRTE